MWREHKGLLFHWGVRGRGEKRFQGGAHQQGSACHHQDSFAQDSLKTHQTQEMMLSQLWGSIFCYDPPVLRKGLIGQTCVVSTYMSNRFFSFQAQIEWFVSVSHRAGHCPRTASSQPRPLLANVGSEAECSITWQTLLLFQKLFCKMHSSRQPLKLILWAPFCLSDYLVVFLVSLS